MLWSCSQSLPREWEEGCRVRAMAGGWDINPYVGTQGWKGSILQERRGAYLQCFTVKVMLQLNPGDCAVFMQKDGTGREWRCWTQAGRWHSTALQGSGRWAQGRAGTGPWGPAWWQAASAYSLHRGCHLGSHWPVICTEEADLGTW